MRDINILISFFLVICIPAVSSTCSYEDNPAHNPGWKSGRNGKFCVTGSRNAEFNVQFTKKPKNWYPNAIKVLQSNGVNFKVKFQSWAVTDSKDKTCSDYTMHYTGNGEKSEFKEVQIGGDKCKRKGAPIQNVPSHSPTSCHYKDTHVVNTGWKDGRNGKLCVDIPPSKVFTITLTQGVKEWALHFMEIIEKVSSSIYKVRFKSWVTTSPSGQTCSDYTMRYYGNGLSGDIKSIVYNSLKCSDSETGAHHSTIKPATNPPTTASSTTNITTSKRPVTKQTSTKPHTAPSSTKTTTTSKKPTTKKSSTTADPCKNIAENSCNSYKCALKLSILFYEAQRSGELPPDNRIPWRSSSTRKDGIWSNEKSIDLTGGYFDAGDYVKFNFPQAAAMTMLAWGLVKYENGYEKAGELNNGLEALKWGIDYLKKCHTKPTELWGQVGNGNIDHSKWERPENQYPDNNVGNNKENYSKNRPIYKIDKNSPGSDLAAEVAASFAAASIVFKNRDKKYSDDLIKRARELYNFAARYRGKYSDSIKDANQFYRSWSGYFDELALASIWLYIATGETIYLNFAEQYWDSMDHSASEISWDNKGRAVSILLAEVTGKPKYVTNVNEFYNRIKSMKTTDYGTKFIQKWGSNRHIANVAFAFMVASSRKSNSLKNQLIEFSKNQINMLLGYNVKQQSFLIGYGKNYPKNPHHSSSSCPAKSCGWGFYKSSQQNNFILKGALVGGPKCVVGCYEDTRKDYVTNEVTLDYNAGFQSALAALVENCKD